ncbi:SRPBCC family protein [Streptomyces guryensis]|uniref:SRPBCC family protein n=1 Tax=Streptomyces guryensis TaxID=2886947 RepID=A0A9Q3Z509_9ACTN|nr:SRPBCC family protein [Streptomyces guryensis]MCD9874258.1 SRPBCC family protein [Streptomyces guryensis]
MTTDSAQRQRRPQPTIREEGKEMTLPMETRSDEGTGISSVTVDVPVEASAAFTWDVIRDIYAVDTRLIPGFAVTVEKRPDSRVVTFANGMRATERIVELDDDARRLQYQVTDSTVTHHLGTQVVREDDAGVHLMWTTEFAPASLLDFTTTNMRTAAQLMKTTIDTAYANQR